MAAQLSRRLAFRRWTTTVVMAMKRVDRQQATPVTRDGGRHRLYHCGPSIEVPSMSLSHYVFKDVDTYGHRVALVDGVSGEETTYSRLREEVAAVARGLRGLGLGPGDTVTLFGSNSPYFAHVLLAVTDIGAVVSTANSQLTADDLTQQLEASGTCLLITSPDCADRALGAAGLSHNVKEVVVLGESPGCLPFRRLLSDNGGRRGEEVEAVRPEADHVAILPFSSGTTGLPKGVRLTHGNLVSQLAALRQPRFLPLTVDDTSVSALPMVHMAGLLLGLCNPLAQGARVVVLPRFKPLSFLNAVQQYKCTFAQVAPPVMTWLAKDPVVSDYDLTSFTTLYCGAAALSASLTQAVEDRLGLHVIRQGFGLTETSVTHIAPLDGWKHGSVGVPLPNTCCKVVDPDSQEELGAGQQGEILVKGPQVMPGYLNNQAATHASFTHDGWFKTGDIGYYDEDNHYFIVDRLKDIIKYKGHQIAPAYLEAVLLDHPDVKEAAVVGVPTEGLGELATAWVVPKDTCCTADQLQLYVNGTLRSEQQGGRVAPYRRLRGGIHIVESIPKSPSGKILRRIIRDIALERYRLEQKV